ncbi:oxygen-independent coproporphyrinogen III oxidase-like protein [Polynucleobacter sp. MWH-Spelu-300-X4]|uniref:radical SAM family heme chaperone HemW n=1 Tax=Polynucleobacter sp. MWH-Spelu-300-X4 TaxID=2689109 RepID=UPI001BFE38BF|nr:radical SAM family heme chaperone HemW [Polynucleobacter sp. MWH-Spelu-300-X4]QWD79334.1 oxygen-independent coproporphyrinogen III oxidase-like protein [Polynucleobacter sp. MWH-Spelu-300-X4]
MLQALPPLSLYVHIPWCIKKCPYCDFNSHQIKDGKESGFPAGFDEQRYLEALRLDLQSTLPKVWGRKVQTIFIGGGTPSLLSKEGLDQLLSDIRALLPLNADAEITMEANPGTFEKDKFKSFAESGVNRISLGIQSFDDSKLQALGRVHDSEQAKAAIRAALELFDQVNIDLMYALPGQSLNDALADIQQAISFDPGHISLYHLTLEPNTLFAKYPPALPDDDSAFEMLDHLMNALEKAGYSRYEVSAYAKKGRQCQHNLNYWQFGDYIGIGAGAHGKISEHNRITRQVNERHPDSYMTKIFKDGHALIEERTLDKNDLPFEYMLNALRLIEGVPTHAFNERTGIPLAQINPMLEAAVKKQLLDADPRTLKATPLGMQYLNDLQMLFLK